MPAPRLLAALSATALIMTLAACSTGSETESSDERLTPLGDFFAAVYGDTDDDEWMKRAEEDNREREIIVAGCMAEQGFEYEPVVDMGFSSSEIEWEPDDREWVAPSGGPCDDDSAVRFTPAFGATELDQEVSQAN